MVTRLLTAGCIAALASLLVAVPVIAGADGSEDDDPDVLASDFSVVVPEIVGPDGVQLPNSLVNPPRVPEAATPEAPAGGGSGGGRGSGGGGGGDAGGVGSSALFGGPGSPWVQRLAAGAPIDPNSSAFVAGLNAETFKLAMTEWSIPVYYADASTPRYDIPLRADWAPESVLRSVPIPNGARPDSQADAHITVVDRSNGCVYDFWGASGSGGDMSALWGNALPANGDGIYAGGHGTRGSGFSNAVGLVTADELRRGAIEHALVFAYPDTAAGGPVAPATKSDGQSTSSSALPQGARVRLDPSIDLESFGLSRAELTIARAMQRYGMILGDTSGAFTIYAQNPQSLAAGAFSGLLPEQSSVDMSNIPTQHLQVMDLPPQQSNDTRVVGNRCNGY